MLGWAKNSVFTSGKSSESVATLDSLTKLPSAEFSVAFEAFGEFLSTGLAAATEPRPVMLDPHGIMRGSFSCQMLKANRALVDALRLTGSTYLWTAISAGEMTVSDFYQVLGFTAQEPTDGEINRRLAFMKAEGFEVWYAPRDLIRLQAELSQMARSYEERVLEAMLTYKIKCIEACRDALDHRLSEAQRELEKLRS